MLPPTNGDKTYTVKKQRNALDIATFWIGVGTLVALAVYTAFNYCLYQTTNAQLTETRNNFKTSERASVGFGSKDGTLITCGPILREHQTLRFHFHNGGLSSARHLLIQIQTSKLSPAKQIQHRHRFVTSNGIKGTISPGPEIDVAAQGDTSYLFSQPESELPTPQELRDTKHSFFLHGEIQYCDVFGDYHCTAFGARYDADVGEFVPSVGIPCHVESGDTEAWRNFQKMNLGASITEVQQCEQPDEPEYYRDVFITTTIAVGSPMPTASGTTP
jgi:hypothetical protein